MRILSENSRQTLALGTALARLLKAGDIVCLYGDLGTGKTVLTRGISLGLGVKGRGVISPTFVLMRCHTGRIALYHFDLYRLRGPDDLAALGCEEFFFSDGVCVIEWAERLGFQSPAEYLRVELEHVSGDRRRLRFSAHGRRYREILDNFKRGLGKSQSKRKQK